MSNIKKILKETPLETRLFVQTEMDYIDLLTALGFREDKMWTDEEEELAKKLSALAEKNTKKKIEVFKQWIKDGSPTDIEQRFEAEKLSEFVQHAATFSFKAHASVNQKYDTLYPYSYHLIKVYFWAKKFIHLINEEYRDFVLAACFTHDLIEDARLTYNDILSNFNESIAEITYALSNDKGKTRKERAGTNYYRGILDTPFAPFVKVCDRLANVEHSKETGSSMFNKYRGEYKNFCANIFSEEYKEMFFELKNLLYL